MSGAYELFHVNDVTTADLALKLVEAEFPDCHPWLPVEGRAEYMLRFGLCYVLFKDDEYRGFFAIMTDEAGAFIHLGTTGRAYAARDVLWCLPRAQSIAANVYGIPELFCEVTDDRIVKLIGKMGWTDVGDNIYSIEYNGH